MRKTIPGVFVLLFCLLAPLLATAGDDLEGLWSYQSYESTKGESEPLFGLFWFQGGRFIHQAMHGGEPLQRQLTDAHLGRYRIRPGGVVQLDVEKGIVVNPGASPLLSPRSDTSHQVSYERSGDELSMRYANGASERLVRIATERMEIFNLGRGALALADQHFVLVVEPTGGWIAGSGRYRRQGEQLQLEVWRWFQVEGGEAHHSADERMVAFFDRKELRLATGERFLVLR